MTTCMINKITLLSIGFDHDNGSVVIVILMIMPP